MRARNTLLASWLLALPAAAAEPDGLTEKDFLGEVPVVISVSRLPQPLNEAPGAVTIIDRDLIRRSGAREIADVLRLVPGFQTTQARGGNPLAVYHGTFFDLTSRIQVLVDGRSVYSPHYVGSASIGMRTVPLEDIERIEVLRGSNSATYGARAVLGVINIVTRDAADTRGGLVAINAGERELLDATARAGWGDESASWRVTADTRGDAGFAPSDRNRLGSLNLRGDLRASARDTVELRAGASDQRWSDGFADAPTNPPRTREYYGGYFQADWRHSPSTSEELRVSYSHNEERYQDRYSILLGALPPGLVDFGGDGRVDALELNHRFTAAPTLRLSWGAELRSERTRAEPLYATSEWIDTRFSRLHANAEWRAHPALIVNAGAMLEESNASDTALLPRVMANWLVTPRHTLRAGVSYAHRPPSVFERQADQRIDFAGAGFAQNWLASAGVRAEKLRASEVGYYGDWRELRATLDVRAFHERIEDFLRVGERAVPPAAGALNSDASTFVNDRTLTMRGVEYQALWRPLGATRVMVAQSFVDADFPIDGDFLSVPRNTSSLAWLQGLPRGWDFSLMHSYVGAITWSGPGGMLPSRHRTDLRLAHAFRLGGTRAEAAVVAQNIGGSSPEYLPQLELGRRVFASLRAAF
jgi:iron complex outermembrane receptor protein